MERVNVTLGDGEESLLVLLSVAMSGPGATMSHMLGHRRGRPPGSWEPCQPTAPAPGPPQTRPSSGCGLERDTVAKVRPPSWEGWRALQECEGQTVPTGDRLWAAWGLRVAPSGFLSLLQRLILIVLKLSAATPHLRAAFPGNPTCNDSPGDSFDLLEINPEDFFFFFKIVFIYS